MSALSKQHNRTAGGMTEAYPSRASNQHGRILKVYFRGCQKLFCDYREGHNTQIMLGKYWWGEWIECRWGRWELARNSKQTGGLWKIHRHFRINGHLLRWTLCSFHCQAVTYDQAFDLWLYLRAFDLLLTFSVWVVSSLSVACSRKCPLVKLFLPSLECFCRPRVQSRERVFSYRLIKNKF